MSYRLPPQDTVPAEVVNDIFACALKKQTGVSLKYMLDFGANPFERQMILSAQVSMTVGSGRPPGGAGGGAAGGPGPCPHTPPRSPPWGGA